ncbi:DUF7619 domain-containing protein [Xanthocytophaga agilis]|uniref:6-bladed beta-propeller n=1 Tax=Xanthocytophaga agilis TaxID=3048010 RepID=A0AAE3RCL1_9BACT|nr:6-bladed beta-propeller [Xanthocytophaga agilis]MDJ1506007.1 6-bladed beta-propeller [Xanthocytophaga agilis]
MKKSLYILQLFILLICSVPLLGQNYTFKKSIGQVILFDPYDVAIDTQGYLYVISSQFIAKLDTNNQLQSIIYGEKYSFLNSLLLDKAGNIWVSDRGLNEIRKYDPTGKLVLRFGSWGGGDGQFIYPHGFAFDSQGNIWVVDQVNDRIQKFDSNGKFLLKFGSQGSANGQFNSPEKITVDAQDNLWITDASNNRIQKFDSNGKFLLKSGSYGSANGQLIYPVSIKVDDDNNIWVTDTFNDRVQKFDSNGKFLDKFGSQGSEDGQLTSLQGMAIDKNRHIWITTATHRIQKFDFYGNYLGKYATQGSSNGQYYGPYGITTDLQGNTYVADPVNSRVQKFDSEGNFISKFGSNGSNDGQFSTARDIITDQFGNVWIVDQDNHRIQKFDSNGRFSAKFGTYGLEDGQFKYPSYIDIDSQGNLWISDTDNNRIQKFDSNGKFLLKFGSQGSANGQLSAPKGIKVDRQGNVWVIDANARVQKFDPSGKFLLRVGSYGNQPGQFGSPTDIAVDTKGNIWISDDSNDNIQQFTPDGKYIASINMYDTGPGYITFDRYDNLYCTSYYFGALVFGSDQLQTFIKGRVYSDENQNCSFDSSDKPLSQIVMVAQPGNYYGITDSTGNYQIQVDTGIFTVSQVLHSKSTYGQLLEPICPATNTSEKLTLKNAGEVVSNINFANKVILTPLLTTNIASDRRRRCMKNNTAVSFSNKGHVDATNVKVYIKLPQYVFIESVDKPYIIDKDSNYVFTIGLLKAGESGTIHIIDTVACERNIVGLTQCTKVWITPANSYTLPDNSLWDKSDIVLKGKCIENGRVQMVIKNAGLEAMADSSEFRILLNAQLAFRKNYKLIAGDSLVLKIPANGKTIRLEADQRPDHPHKSQTNLTIEGCMASSMDMVSKGFVDVLPQDDAEPEVAIECLPIIDSYDPNDKLVSPAGTSNNHYTPTTSELKYVVRFQNTGTDYAYKVVVVDTLSENLDISTLQMGSVSHAYTLKVSGKGHPVLTWTFNDINLPDSTRDQTGSNGFIQFSIKPKTGLSEKARIENFADIFFDYNDPVRTNTTANVLYDIPPVITEENKLNEKGLLFLIPTISSFTPEQAQVGEQLTITGTNYQPVITDNTVKINGITATVVSANETQLVVTVPQGVTAGKVSVTTPGGTATSETVFVMKPTASEQPQWSRPIVISPNPTEGRFTIDFSKTGVQIQAIEIYNHLGQQISPQTVSKATARKEVDLSDTGTGIYLIVFKTDKGNATRKLIVK